MYKISCEIERIFLFISLLFCRAAGTGPTFMTGHFGTAHQPVVDEIFVRYRRGLTVGGKLPLKREKAGMEGLSFVKFQHSSQSRQVATDLLFNLFQ